MSQSFVRPAVRRRLPGPAHAALACAVVSAFALGLAGPARAQAAPGGASAGEAADDARAKLVRASAEKAERLRAAVEAMRTQRQRLEQDDAGDGVDDMLRASNPQLARAARDAASLQGMLAQRYGAFITSDAALGRVVRQLGQVRDLAQLELAQRARRVRSESRAEARADAPAGYLGVSYSGAVRQVTHNGEVLLYHDDAPVVESVEPGSPAARAGIRSGDTLVSYDGVVLRRRAVALNEMLRPGRAVDVRLRRNGADKTVRVVVGRRPQTYVVGPQGPGADIEVTFGPMLAIPQIPPVPPGAAFAPTAPATAAVTMRAPRVVQVAPSAPVGTWVFGGTSSAVAGAQVVPMDDSWRDLLGGPDEGLVVVAVARGTPASAAGLRNGDVITAADGRAVVTPAALQRAVQGAGDRSVALTVVRRREQRTVTLSW